MICAVFYFQPDFGNAGNSHFITQKKQNPAGINSRRILAPELQINLFNHHAPDHFPFCCRKFDEVNAAGHGRNVIIKVMFSLGLIP